MRVKIIKYFLKKERKTLYCHFSGLFYFEFKLKAAEKV